MVSGAEKHMPSAWGGKDGGRKKVAKKAGWYYYLHQPD